MSSSSDSDVDEPDVAPIESAWSLIVFWAAASTATAIAEANGLGGGYFDVVGLALIVSSSCLIYHHREKILEWWADRRESWRKAGEPIDPDEVIDDVVDDGNGGGSA